jgi:DNA gyrase subunit A
VLRIWIYKNFYKNMPEENEEQNLNEEKITSKAVEPAIDDLRYGYLKPREIVTEMQESFLDYAMSVIVQRALPDVRDGMKPIHRRILYSMWNTGLRASAKFTKSARIVGDVMGKYHPHGDTAIYDTMVRMAQDFSMRYPFVNGQGNFGSMDGDSAAAMRYTEAKLTKVAEEMLFDLEKETVNFIPNYDGSQQEPQVLPSKVPSLLLNGVEGIAVGMATKIPPHNLGELVDATTHLIDNKESTVEDLMQFIPGPDFPTGGSIYNAEEIKQAYTTGKGRVVMRGEAKIEEGKKGGDFKIIITELPYQVNKSTLVEKIAMLHKEKKIIGISDLRDESDRDGVRVVIELKKDAYPQKILNSLYKMTALQDTFSVNMLALVDGIQPRVLNLKEVLEYYIAHRKEVVIRRTQFELKKAKDRMHILEGLKIALDHLDEVISTIRKSKNKEEAKENLMKKFKLSDIQSQAILDMRLSALAALERQKVEDEYKEVKALIKELESILSSESRIMSIIKQEMLEVKEKHGNERRTRIVKKAIGQFRDEDLVPNEEVIVTLSEGGYIKRMPISTYRTQGRGGKGVIGATMKDEDSIAHITTTMNHDYLLFFTNKGRVFQTRTFEIPASSRIAKGQAVVNIIQIGSDEKVTSMITLKNPEQEGYMFMITKKGTIKKTKIADYKNVRKSGIIAIKLDSGDELHWVKLTSGKDDVMMVSALGQSIRFNETDARPMGRASRGVRGMKMKGNDFVVGSDVITEGEKGLKLLVLSENGLGKKTPIEEYTAQNRGGSGVKTANVTDKTGKLIGTMVVDDSKDMDLICISKEGQVIRTPIGDIRTIGRSTQGVKIMRMHEGDKIASMSIISNEEEQEENNNDGVTKGGEENKKPKTLEIKTKEDSIKKEIEEISELKKIDEDLEDLGEESEAKYHTKKEKSKKVEKVKSVKKEKTIKTLLPKKPIKKIEKKIAKPAVKKIEKKPIKKAEVKKTKPSKEVKVKKPEGIDFFSASTFKRKKIE